MKIRCKSILLVVKNYAAGLWLSVAVLKPELWIAGVLEYWAMRGIYSIFNSESSPKELMIFKGFKGSRVQGFQ